MNNTWLENRIIKKIKNFLLPEATPSDSGKTVVVNEIGNWELCHAGSNDLIIYDAIPRRDYSTYDTDTDSFYIVYTLECNGEEINWSDLNSDDPYIIIAHLPYIKPNLHEIDFNLMFGIICDFKIAHNLYHDTMALSAYNLSFSSPSGTEHVKVTHSEVAQSNDTPDAFYTVTVKDDSVS